MTTNLSKVYRLKEIADYIQENKIQKELDQIRERLERDNNGLVIALVGEYSSGKTSLINALTDSKILETSSKPTTSTLYEIKFGCPEFKVNYQEKNGTIVDVGTEYELKNSDVSDALVVNVFDTSKKLPSSTILVDTPGLSSLKHEHYQILSGFMPLADVILLVVDVEQQITKSLKEFVKEMPLKGKPIYIVLTKKDLKDDSELEEIIEEIADETDMDVKKIVSTSAKENDMDELISLINNDIQNYKDDIIETSFNNRLDSIGGILQEEIENILRNTEDFSNLEEKINEQESLRNQLEYDIEKLKRDSQIDFEKVEVDKKHKIEDEISNKLNKLISETSKDYDEAAISIIGRTLNQTLQEIRADVQQILRDKVNNYNKENKETQIPFIILPDISFLNLEYSMNLNSAGHKYDGMISKSIKIAFAVAATMANDKYRYDDDAIQKVIISTATMPVKEYVKHEDILEAQEDLNQTYNRIELVNNAISKALGTKQDALTTLVSKVTDKLMGEAERKKIVNDFINNELLPYFDGATKNMINQTIQNAEDTIRKEMNVYFDTIDDNVNKLRTQLDMDKHEYENRINTLQGYLYELKML